MTFDEFNKIVDDIYNKLNLTVDQRYQADHLGRIFNQIITAIENVQGTDLLALKATLFVQIELVGKKPKVDKKGVISDS